MKNKIEWVITDTHLYHEKMMEVGRPVGFEDIIKHNCQKMIRECDTLYHLGDVIFKYENTLKEWLDDIPCRKILIRGNHDRNTRSWYTRFGFDFVADSIQLGDVILSHKPLQHLPDGATFNIHGHWHNTEHRRHEVSEWYDHKYFKLALEDTNYKPVQLQRIVAKWKKN